MKNLVCHFRGHKYSDRQIRSTIDGCENYEKCIRCNHEHIVSRTKHSSIRDWEYYWERKSRSRSSCVYVKRCKVCSQVLGEEIQHTTKKSKWQATNEKSCEYELRCQRCKAVAQKRVMHTEKWSDNTACVQVLSCEKCSTVLKYEINHVYDNTSNDELCKGIRKCIKCGAKTTVPPEHNFQLIRSKIDRGAHGSVESHEYYKCTRCGFEKTEFEWSDDSSRDW